MIKGVIFDLDGVLLDSLLFWRDLGATYLRSLGKEPADDLSEQLFPLSMAEGAAYLIREYRLNVSSEAVLAEIERLLETYYLDEVGEKSGVVTVLEAFKQREIPMVVATASPRYHTESALKRLGLLSYFEGVVTVEEVGKGKSAPLIYQIGAKQLAAKPHDVLVIEDSLYALITAKKAGFRTVGIYDLYGESEQAALAQMADIYVKKWSDFSVADVLGD